MHMLLTAQLSAIGARKNVADFNPVKHCLTTGELADVYYSKTFTDDTENAGDGGTP
jgi:hypothetical protein